MSGVSVVADCIVVFARPRSTVTCSSSIDAGRIETCSAGRNGVLVNSGSGQIGTLVASGNGGGLDMGGISVGSVQNQQCAVPSIAEIIGSGDGGGGGTVPPEDAVTGGVEDLTVRPE